MIDPVWQADSPEVGKAGPPALHEREDPGRTKNLLNPPSYESSIVGNFYPCLCLLEERRES